jgi:hypothetical protein
MPVSLRSDGGRVHPGAPFGGGKYPAQRVEAAAESQQINNEPATGRGAFFASSLFSLESKHGREGRRKEEA